MEEKTMSKEDLERINKIRDEYTELTFRFGQLYMDKAALVKRVEELDRYNDKLDEQYENIKISEINLMKELEEKYGEGVLNLETGKIKVAEEK